MREVDRLTTELYGIPSIILMENAAHAVARVITEKLGGSVTGRRILILCGKGNNGGDGAALARVLWSQGASCFVDLFGSISDSTGDARRNFESIQKFSESPLTNGPNENCLFLHEIRPGEVAASVANWRNQQMCVLVDALFGTGLSRPLDEEYETVVNAIAGAKKSKRFEAVFAVDMPSGLISDSGIQTGPSADVDVTVTFTAPKLANVLPPVSNLNGELIVANIGTPSELLDDQPSQLFLAEKADITYWLKQSDFVNASYKNKRGHALIIGGSRDYSGAAVLAGNAGIRSGVGLVTVAVPEDSRDGVIGRVTPEVMVRGISQTEKGSAAEKAADEVKEFLKNVDVVAIGNGLSAKEDETKNFVRRIVSERSTPIVIDADAITALSPWEEKGIKGTDDLPLILTPHEGEFKKMLGVEGDEVKEILKDRVGAVRDFATKHKLILVLKGERNLIGHPDGRVVVNPTGNSGLGKAGNGDTLTGIIAGFVAQAVQMEIDIFETVVAAVYIAGMAGDIAASKFGKRVMTASDVRDCLGDVFNSFESGGTANGGY